MAIHAQKDITLNTIPAYTSLLGGHFVYYQGDSSGTVASANVVQNPTSSPSNWGYNTHIGANGIQLRDGTTAYTVLNQDGLTVSKGGIQGGIIGQPEGIYLSTLDFPLRELTKTTDITIDNTKTYYQLINEEYSIVTQPKVDELINYYELTSTQTGLDINGHIPTIAKTGLNIDNTDPAWRQIIGNKFGVDSEGNLYASNATITGAITANSLTINDSEGTYDGIAAINLIGYTIDIIEDNTGVIDVDSTTYLYPILYNNGEQVEVDDYSQFIWYVDDSESGIHGESGIGKGRILASYNHRYKVTYSFEI